MTDKTPNYTVAQESIIASFTPSINGVLSFADAETIAAMPEMNHPENGARKAKSIVAKIGRMQLPYAKKVAARKDGSKVETKQTLVDQIAASTGLTFEALSNAARADLVKLRDVLAA